MDGFLLALLSIAAAAPLAAFVLPGAITGLVCWLRHKDRRQAVRWVCMVNLAMAPLVVISTVIISVGPGGGGRGSPIILLLFLGPIALVSTVVHAAILFSLRRRKDEAM